MSAWTAFWLFLAVYVVCECYLYSNGHDTLFWKHKTPAELAIQAGKCGAAASQGVDRKGAGE